MQREIKFRFWHAGFKTMHSWENMKKGWEEHEDDLGVFIETPGWKPMQYTGLLDKNGKEIFEGDIVKFIDPMPVEPREKIAQVRFVFEDGFMPIVYPFVNITSYNYSKRSFDGFGINSQNCEVIGNRFENPELLEETT